MLARSITLEAITNGTIVENNWCDFKEQVDLESERGKQKFIDDVCALLNREGGHLIVGVKEKAGRFSAWAPNAVPDGDIDALARRIQSLVQTCVEPAPLQVQVYDLPHDHGAVVIVQVAEFRMQPYQNKLTGGFVIRTDKQNKIIPRDEIGAHFKRFEDYRADLKRMMDEERTSLAARNLMVEDGPVLTIGILPREHYTGHPALEKQRDHTYNCAPLFPYYRDEVGDLRGCPSGLEAVDSRFDKRVNCRVLVSDEWFVHATIVHPFSSEPDGRVGIFEMRTKLEVFLNELQGFLEEHGVNGPFAVSFEFSHLQRGEKTSWCFPHTDQARFAPRTLFREIQAKELAELAFQAVKRASQYG